MSHHHRRRFLNVVTRNWRTDAYSLHRVDLDSSENSLFYPTAAAAEEAAAAAQDPSALFGGGAGARRHVALEEVPELRLPAAEQSFVQRHALSPSPYDLFLLYCVALSESQTVFLDFYLHAAFLYDAGERCVVTLPYLRPYLRDKNLAPLCLSVAGAGNDVRSDETIYIIDRALTPTQPPATATAALPRETIDVQALVRSKWRNTIFYRRDDRWRRDDLPPPPYVGGGTNNGGGGGGGGGWDTKILSHALVGGGGGGDVICVSTCGAGTYCLDTATRRWSKAGDWALDFAGEVVRDADLGVWAGFMHYRRKDEVQRLCATADLLSAAGRRRAARCRDAPPGGGYGGGCKDLEPPQGWYKDRHFLPMLVSLGSGKFCAVQFFETHRELEQGYREFLERAAESSGLSWEEVSGDYDQDDLVVDKFAVFTGIEVVRCAAAGGNGGGAGEELRVVVHKSRRQMLTDSDDADIVFVL